MNLEGTKEYLYGNTRNPLTDKQEAIVNIIKEYLGIEFKGKYSREAYQFIGKYHNFIRIQGNKVSIRKSINSAWKILYI